MVENLSVLVSLDEIKQKKYNFFAGQYFEAKIEYEDISIEEFEDKLDELKGLLSSITNEQNDITKEIIDGLEELKLDI